MFGFSASRPATVQRCLVDEPNGLRIQSQDHPDGWGIGYYPEGGDSPLIVRSINPAFADAEFAQAASRVSARTVIAHVRRASCGPIALDNTHPFHHDRWLFAHNGTVSRFAQIRAELEASIDPDLRALARGDTDSERCFLLLLTRLRVHGPLDGPFAATALATALYETVARVRAIADVGAKEPSSLTFILSDGNALVAYRSGRSLHFSLDAPLPPESGARSPASGEHVRELMVASEVLSAERSWTEVPENGIVGIDDSRTLLQL